MLPADVEFEREIAHVYPSVFKFFGVQQNFPHTFNYSESLVVKNTEGKPASGEDFLYFIMLHGLLREREGGRKRGC
jgi:hypothetical protein